MTDGAEEAARSGAPQGHRAEVQHERTLRRIRVAHGMAAHKPYREMAHEEGCGVSTIVRDVKVLRRYWMVRSAVDYDAAIAEEVGKLDIMEREAMRQIQLDHVLVSHGKIIPGVIDEGAKLAALDRLLKIQDRRARLKGYDKPTRTEAKVTVEHTTELDEEIERLMELMPRADTVDADADG